MGALAAIKAKVGDLAQPATAGAAALAIDHAYRQLWADVHDLGTLFSLRQGLLARNLLYEGNAVAHIYRLLKSGNPCIKDHKIAAALLSILSALLTDVPAAFAAEGYGIHVHDVMDDGELIVPDTSELNAMRAQPLFVTLALDTLLHRPESSDHDPHVCVGYLNDLIAMDGVDYITSTAMQKLLDDLGFRSSLLHGLTSQDPHKLFKCLQILKRCIGGGPGMLVGFRSTQVDLSPQWTLQKLLAAGAEQSLVTACNTVAQMVREHTVERQLLGLLHTTLLDIFELLYIGDTQSNAGQQQWQRHQQQGSAAAAVTAAAAAAGSDHADSSGSSNCYWPGALVAAHAGLVVEVARLVPFLITSISRMKPYSSSDAVCRALHQLGAGQSMSALVAVLDSGDPTSTLVLQQEIEAYQVLNSICQRDLQLALAALTAGAPRTIHSALLEWAEMLPPPMTDDQLEQFQECSSHELEDVSIHSNRSLQAGESMHSESSGIFDVEGLGDQAAAAPPALHSCSAVRGEPTNKGAAVNTIVQIRGRRLVDPQIAAAVTAAMQLLLTLLRASTNYCHNSSDRSSSPVNNTAASVAACSAGAASAVVGSGPSSAAVSLSVLCKHQGLPQLLVDLGQLQIFELLAIDCLVELDNLRLLPAAVKEILDAAVAAARAAAGAGANSVDGSMVVTSSSGEAAVQSAVGAQQSIGSRSVSHIVGCASDAAGCCAAGDVTAKAAAVPALAAPADAE